MEAESQGADRCLLEEEVEEASHQWVGRRISETEVEVETCCLWLCWEEEEEGDQESWGQELEVAEILLQVEVVEKMLVG